MLYKHLIVEYQKDLDQSMVNKANFNPNLVDLTKLEIKKIIKNNTQVDMIGKTLINDAYTVTK